MSQRGLRSTEQRRNIVDTFFATDGHISIEELLTVVKKSDPRIGYATVYRTLKMLAESGVASERQFGDGFTRYEVAEENAHHDHLICTRCGTIEEFEAPEIEVLQTRVSEEHGFEVSYHRHELYGTCRRCKGIGPPPSSR